jgi:hypothetical protein
MQKQIGLWIDHRKTVMVILMDGSETTREIISGLEKRPRFSDNPRAKIPDEKMMAMDENSRDRQYEKQLEGFYTQVFSQIKDAGAILIIGPGEAKNELEKFIKDQGQGSRIVGVEPADKLTVRQLASKVRQFYNVKKQKPSLG